MKHVKTQAAFDKAIEANGVVLVDFYMSWCNPCGKLKPILAEIEKEYAEQQKPLSMITLEIDDIPDMSRKYKVSAVPALFFFVNGKESGKKIVGFKEKPDIVERIDRELKKV